MCCHIYVWTMPSVLQHGDGGDGPAPPSTHHIQLFPLAQYWLNLGLIWRDVCSVGGYWWHKETKVMFPYPYWTLTKCCGIWRWWGWSCTTTNSPFTFVFVGLTLTKSGLIMEWCMWCQWISVAKGTHGCGVTTSMFDLWPIPSVLEHGDGGNGPASPSTHHVQPLMFNTTLAKYGSNLEECRLC